MLGGTFILFFVKYVIFFSAFGYCLKYSLVYKFTHGSLVLMVIYIMVLISLVCVSSFLIISGFMLVLWHPLYPDYVWVQSFLLYFEDALCFTSL